MKQQISQHFLFPTVSALIATIKFGDMDGVCFLENSHRMLQGYREWKRTREAGEKSALDHYMESLLYFILQIIAINVQLIPVLHPKVKLLEWTKDEPQGHRKREGFHPAVSNMLQSWCRENPSKRHPGEEDLERLSLATGLRHGQILEWISNSRKRNKV